MRSRRAFEGRSEESINLIVFFVCISVFVNFCVCIFVHLRICVSVGVFLEVLFGLEHY